jgi:hypothetical protein
MVNLVQTATAICDKNWFTQGMYPVWDGFVTSLDVSTASRNRAMSQTALPVHTVEAPKPQPLKKRKKELDCGLLFAANTGRK